MRGEILHYDVTQGIGFITAEDGNRYMFSRSDLMQAQRVGKGTRIDFQPDGQNARQVYISDPRGPAQTTASSASVPPAGPPPIQPQAGPQTGAPIPPQPTAPAGPAYPNVAYNAAPQRGVWDSFIYCCTGGYANFRDRARRTEYWGFLLFYIIAIGVLSILGVMIDAAMDNFEGQYGFPIVTSIGLTLALLYFMVPILAVHVRRFHDVGLSGWLYVLFFVLSFIWIGGIIIFVISLLPSQKHDNKWGPVPGGVRF